MTYPPFPILASIRLALAGDVARLAELSVLGFKDSEIFATSGLGTRTFRRIRLLRLRTYIVTSCLTYGLWLLELKTGNY